MFLHLCNNGTLAQYNYTNIINTKSKKLKRFKILFMFLWIIPFVTVNHFQDVSRCSCCQGFILTRKIFVHFLYTQHFASKVWQFYTFALMIIFCDHLDICLKQILSCRRNFTRSSSPWTSATFGPPPAHKGILFLLFMFIFSSNIK